MDGPFVFNPFDEATRRDPFPVYRRARRECPVYPHEGFLVPVASVFRYADVLAILRDHATWSNRFPPPPGVDPAEFPDVIMLGQDPPEHDRIRRLVSQAFTPRIVRQLEPRMQAIADELFDAALAKGEVDFVRAFAYPFPVIVIAEILGVPAEDRERFKRWSDEAVANLGSGLFMPPSPERLARLRVLFAEMGQYFHDLAEDRRRTPHEDLVSGLVRAEVEGARLTHDELIRLVVLLLVAGHETTTGLLGNMVLTLLDHPAELARLRAAPELVPAAVEEVLRFASPVQMDPRRATRDVELHGHRIPKGSVVIMWLGSANRDEEVFPDAERFDITRADNRHLAFGFGIHYCLGANLARLEAQVALRTLLARTRDFARTDGAPLPLHSSIVFRAVRQLPLRLKPA